MVGMYSIIQENNRLQMQLEDVTTQLLNTQQKLSKVTQELKDLKYFEAKHHGIDVNEMHKIVRNLENEVEMYKKKNAPYKMPATTNRICSICSSQIDKHNNRVKKIIVEGGRNGKQGVPANIFLSTDEEPEWKEKREILTQQQEEIMKEFKTKLNGYSDDIESSFKEDAKSEQSNSFEDFKNFPVMRVHSKGEVDLYS